MANPLVKQAREELEAAKSVSLHGGGYGVFGSWVAQHGVPLMERVEELEKQLAAARLEIDDLKNGVGLPREVEAERAAREAVEAQVAALREVLEKTAVGTDPMSWHGERIMCELCGGWGERAGMKRGVGDSPVQHSPSCILADTQATAAVHDARVRRERDRLWSSCLLPEGPDTIQRVTTRFSNARPDGRALAGTDPPPHCPTHGAVDHSHRCRDFDDMPWQVKPPTGSPNEVASGNAIGYASAPASGQGSAKPQTGSSLGATPEGGTPQ